MLSCRKLFFQKYFKIIASLADNVIASPYSYTGILSHFLSTSFSSLQCFYAGLMDYLEQTE